MTEFPSGHLVFAVSDTLVTVHSLASQIGRLKSDAHLLDVGLLANKAWVSAWVKASAEAAMLAKQIGGEHVPLSANAARALMSLGPGLGNDQAAIGLLEVSDVNQLATFFQGIVDCEKNGWVVMEIRVRKSGPSGAHAFFGKSQSANAPSTSATQGFVELAVAGDYRKFF